MTQAEGFFFPLHRPVARPLSQTCVGEIGKSSAYTCLWGIWVSQLPRASRNSNCACAPHPPPQNDGGGSCKQISDDQDTRWAAAFWALFIPLFVLSACGSRSIRSPQPALFRLNLPCIALYCHVGFCFMKPSFFGELWSHRPILASTRKEKAALTDPATEVKTTLQLPRHAKRSRGVRIMALAAADARSETSAAGSARSSGSRKYRVVSRGSNVDESLFGSSKTKTKGSGRRVLVGEVSSSFAVVDSLAVRRNQTRISSGWSRFCVVHARLFDRTGYVTTYVHVVYDQAVL